MHLLDTLLINGVVWTVTDIAEFDDLVRIENPAGKGQFVPKEGLDKYLVQS